MVATHSWVRQTNKGGAKRNIKRSNMTKEERGVRNMAKMRKLASPKVGSGKVTFWNPTGSHQSSVTVHSMDARALTLVHDELNKENQDKFTLNLATVSGYNRMLEFSMSRMSFKVRSVGSL